MSLGSPTPFPPEGANTAGTTAPAVVQPDRGNVATEVALVNRQRVPLTVDPFGQRGQALSATLLASRSQAVSNLFLGMQQVHGSLTQLLITLATPTAPPQLIGVLLQPDSTAAALLQVQFDPAS